MADIPSGEASADAASQVELVFSDWRLFAHLDDPFHKDLSAVALAGDTLFVACDETASLERLTRRRGGGSDGGFGDHRHLPLDPYFRLPAGPEGEMDIEGLSVTDDGWLWIVGSHSWKRRKPDGEDGPNQALACLERTVREPNRYFLGRVPLVEESPGVFALADGEGDRRPACLRFGKKRSALVGWLAEDPHLAPFLAIPSKENGLDVEGIAVRGDRVWLGLRGPVLRGYAVVLELSLKETGPGRLRARRLEGERRYRKHLIDTRGLGIRDMRLDGDDMLLLVGPTMSLEGPAFVLRWRAAAQATASGRVDPKAVTPVAELPYRQVYDHPEGLERWPEGGPGALLVIYDAPAPERTDPKRFAVRADVIRP